MNKKKKVLFDWLGGGGAAAQTQLYPSTYRAFLAGEGTLDYISFGGLARNPNTGRLYCQYRQGSDHNSTRDADIKVTYSDDGFVTKTTVVIAADSAQDPLDNLSGSDCFVNSNGRFFCFYDKQRANGISVTYYKYADQPDLSDLSAEQLYTTDYGGGAYISATGTCFEKNGFMYKSNWASSGISPAAQPTANVIYRCPINSLTWTKIGEISPEVDNYDEACIGLHPNGTFYATIRDNVSKQLIIKSSTDDGVTWGNQVNTGIAAQSKMPILITPSGNFCILARDVPGFRTRIIKGNSVANLSASYLDEHLGAFMYGGLVWDGTKILATHHVETDNILVPGLSGPTITIYREIVESATPVAPPTQYDSAYRCLLDYVQANGETMPSDALQTIQNTVFTSLRSNSMLSSIHYLKNEYHKNASLDGISKRNWVRPWIKITPVGSPTFTVNGYSLNGTTQYLNLVGSRLDNAANLSQNNLGFLSYILNNAADAAFGRVYGVTSCILIPRASDGNCYFRVNGGSNTVFVNANGGGLFFAQRTDSANQKLRRNGTQIGTGAVASLTLTGQSDEIFNGCVNAGGGTPQNFTTKNPVIFVISTGFSGVEATYEGIWNTYISAVDALP